MYFIEYTIFESLNPFEIYGIWEMLLQSWMCLFSERDFDGLVQERRNSIANALELRLSCINPSTLVTDVEGDSWEITHIGLIGE